MSSGPCNKREVVATIVTPGGQRFVGRNDVEARQATCPRAGMATGEGYELCRDVCRQTGHAEVMAVRALQAETPLAPIGSVCYIEGHSYACDDCLRALAMAGVRAVRFCSPDHPALKSDPVLDAYVTHIKANPAKCSLGMGCEQAGVCYAHAMGSPERCGRP